jgi:hypothetical protein
VDTLADIKWEEHHLLTGTFFAKWKCGRRKYTLGKGRMFGGGYAIGGQFNGEYQEIDVQTEEEMNDIMRELQEDVQSSKPKKQG